MSVGAPTLALKSRSASKTETVRVGISSPFPYAVLKGGAVAEEAPVSAGFYAQTSNAQPRWESSRQALVSVLLEVGARSSLPAAPAPATYTPSAAINASNPPIPVVADPARTASSDTQPVKLRRPIRLLDERAGSRSPLPVQPSTPAAASASPFPSQPTSGGTKLVLASRTRPPIPMAGDGVAAEAPSLASQVSSAPFPGAANGGAMPDSLAFAPLAPLYDIAKLRDMPSPVSTVAAPRLGAKLTLSPSVAAATPPPLPLEVRARAEKSGKLRATFLVAACVLLVGGGVWYYLQSFGQAPVLNNIARPAVPVAKASQKSEPQASTPVASVAASVPVAVPAVADLPVDSVPVAQERPLPAANFVAFANNAKISAVMSNRAMLNGRVYFVGDTVDFGLAIRLAQISADDRLLLLEDANGAQVRIHYN